MFTFSASLAVSRAFGSVVRICSCSKSEVTKFLDTAQPGLLQRYHEKRTEASASDAMMFLKIYGTRRHVSCWPVKGKIADALGRNETASLFVQICPITSAFSLCLDFLKG